MNTVLQMACSWDRRPEMTTIGMTNGQTSPENIFAREKTQ